MITPVPLLRAKLLPPSPGPLHLARPRLHRRLAGGLDRRATVVVAGPGYGKTGLVARFLSELGGDSVWCWLDPAFRYLIQGVKDHTPEFGERSEGLWDSLRSRSDEPERLADIFIGDAQESLGGRMVLVLDNVQHLAGNEPSARALRRLLVYLPGALHLVLVGRSLPEIGLHALAGEDAVNVLQGDELLFTPEETLSLLRETFALPIKDETAARVHARTRGWVTALQLLRQTARLDRGAADLPEEIFVRTEAEIFDYFSEEVLSAESAEARDFLLGSAPPAVIDPDICAEVLGGKDVGEILARLVKRSLFLSPLESRGEYYAYDPLFRDFLKRKLRGDRGAAGARDLDLRYGKAFARRGDFAQALAHFVAADDPRRVLALLDRHGRTLLSAGMIGPVRDGTHFVEARQGGGRVVHDLLGEACRLAGDYAAAVGHFEKALQPEASAGLPALAGADRARTLQGLAYALLKTGDAPRAARLAEEARTQAGPDDPALMARILNTLSIIRYRENRLPEAILGWQEALARARQAGDRHVTLMIAHNLGLPHAVLGDFRRAAECFRILTGADNPRLGPEEGAAYLNLARIATLRGEHAQAAAHLGDAREIAHKWRLQSLTADVLEAEGILLRESGDLQGAAGKLGQARALLTELGLLDLLDGLTEEEAILAARRGEVDLAERLAAAVAASRRGAGDAEGAASALLALGEIRAGASRAETALAPLDEASRLFETLGRAYQRCRARLFFALACHRLDRRERAGRAASEALDLSARYDYPATVLRVADLDEGFRRFLAELPGAPPDLRVPVEEQASPAAAASPISGTGADLHVRLLGPIEVYRTPGRAIPASAWKIRRALQVFCFLASARGHRAAKERIVEALWEDARLPMIEKNFHPTISFLRRALNHGHNVPKNFVVCERGAYLLNPDYRYDIDTERFEERVRSARGRKGGGQVAEALADYESAFAVYRGPFMEEQYDGWAEPLRGRYEELYLAALKEAAGLHLEKRDAAAAVDCLQRLIRRDSLHEEASALLMQALGASGNRAAIEREYDRLVTALHDELGKLPLPATRRAYDEALSAGKSRSSRGRSRGLEPSPG
ncbi:MAG: hypothetical protein AUH92_05270 [Acidobacteria bacterium 13_1_40CM_4_69_4]|nr:MAG: hypothetical protein AUH92_05270 [Acidobacteria bacterium 13_1_40CM_4_69_4]